MADSHATPMCCGKPFDFQNPIVRIVCTRPEADGQAGGRLAEIRKIARCPIRPGTPRMDTPSPTMERLARQLTALEAAGESVAEGAGTWWACQRLQQSLVRLVGEAGLRSLTSRALTLAKAQAPALHTVRVRPDGSFEGPGSTHDDEARVVIVTQLLGLLQTFIGASLTQQLLQDAWPELSVDEIGVNEMGQRGEGRS